MEEEKNVEEIQLDVIPVYINKMYSTKEMIWHFKCKKQEDCKQAMIKEIIRKFNDCNSIIILEKGMVIKDDVYSVGLDVFCGFAETVLKALEDRDKIIDEMARVICKLDTMDNYGTWNNDIEDVKEYFRKKVSDEKNKL